MIHKTCAKAGHRWSVAHGASGTAGAQEWWIELRWCLRQGCRRYRYEDETGLAFTYDLVRHRSHDKKVVAKGLYS